MPRTTRVPIPEKSRSKLLLWSERHCGFCGRPCTTNIEIHHIDKNHRNNDEDNLIPLCFDCHGELARYNPKHPKGTNYREPEIKSRREQIYDMYTLKYLRQVEISISKFCLHMRDSDGHLIPRTQGDISCTVRTLSKDIPVKLRLKLALYHQEEILSDSGLGDHYKGVTLWNLNPGMSVHSHFPFPFPEMMDPFDYRIEIEWSIVDILEREHKMLPFSYRLDSAQAGDWWYHPAIGPYQASVRGT